MEYTLHIALHFTTVGWITFIIACILSLALLVTLFTGENGGGGDYGMANFGKAFAWVTGVLFTALLFVLSFYVFWAG